MKSLLAAIAAIATCGALAATASAQAYPERPVTMVVPFAAGGPGDKVARVVAAAMSADLGQEIVVENIGGAGGSLGAGRVADAEPDGYTLLLHNIGMATGPTLYRQLPFDPLEAFEYVGLVTEAPMTIVAGKHVEAAGLQELIQSAKAGGNEITIGNAGIGSAAHLCGILFMSAIETQLSAVPYPGTGPAMTDMIEGKIDMMCDQATNTTEHIRAGTINAYAVPSATRLDVLPDLPTAEEAGLPDFQIGIWHALYAPRGTPETVVERLTTSLQTALEDEGVIASLAELGTSPSPRSDATPEALKAKLESEIARWKPIIEAAGQYAD